MKVFIGCVFLLALPCVAVLVLKLYYHPAAEQNLAPLSDSAERGQGEVLFFNATWCGPCRQMKPIVTQLRRQGYNLRDIDVDRNRSLTQKYNVSGIPTFVFIENGREVNRFSGGTSPEKLRKMCNSTKYRTTGTVRQVSTSRS